MPALDTLMAWRNIWRHPRRTVLTVLAIAFACLLLVFMLSFQFGSYDTMINSSVKISTGHLQVQAAGYHENPRMRLVVEDPAAVGSILQKEPHLQAYTFRCRGFALASSARRTYGVLVMGIDPEGEVRVSTLRQNVRQGRYLAASDADAQLAGALVGRLLARNLKLSIGDELTLLGQGRDGSIAAAVVKVRGIFASGIEEFDRSTLQIPLAAFQRIFSMGKSVHTVVAVADHLSAVPAIQRKTQMALAGLRNRPPLVVLDWADLMPGLRQAIQMDLISGAIFYFILVLVVAFSILNTFLMAVFERTHEFGVMMALGVRPNRLARLVLTESAGLTLLGVATGVLSGCLLTCFFQEHGIDMSGASQILEQFGISGRIYPRLSWLSAALGPTLVFAVTVLAALYPALKIRRLKPVEAINAT